MSLYNPKHFFVLSVFLGGFVPLWLAAANWRRVGDRRNARLALFGGLGGFLVLTSLLAWIPESMSAVSRLFGYAVNWPIGWILRDQQKDLYRGWLDRGAGSARSAGQALVGLVIVVGVVLVAMIPYIAVIQVHLDRGTEHLVAGDYEAAAEEFEFVLRYDSGDLDALYGSSYAAAGRGRWQVVELNLARYLRSAGDDPTALALYGLAAEARGDTAAARTYLTRAESLERGIVAAARWEFQR